MTIMKDKYFNTLHRDLDDVMTGKVLDPVRLEPILALIALNKARHAVELGERRLAIAFERAGFK